MKDTTGNPIMGAKVTFTDESSPDSTYTGTTDADGVYRIDITVVVGVEDLAPDVFSLGQNYPNPFNPSTTIPFTIETSSHVELDVFNIMGQRVATILDSYMSAGIHQVMWDGCDELGNHLAAGVYLYRLRAGRYSETKKMLMLDGGGVGSARSAKGSIYAYVPQTAKQAVMNTYIVTISHDDIFPFEQTGVSVKDGQTKDFIVIEKEGHSIVNGITFVSIPGGTMVMGSNIGEKIYDFTEERPIHNVALSPFGMSIYEITQGQYKTITGTYPSYFTSDDNRPVEQISWFDAAKFCNELSDAAGLERCYNESTWECDFTKNGFRLPTEAEWEYACRAGRGTEYYWGDSYVESTANQYCWYSVNAGTSHTVGTKLPNKFGLFDIVGNVEEWCNDWFRSNYYSYSPSGDPTGPSSGSSRAIRGGSYRLSKNYIRSARRNYRNPSDETVGVGFRVVRRPYNTQTPRYSLTIDINQSGWGTVTPSRGTLSYYEKSIVEITAIPASGYRFVGWTGTVDDAMKETTWLKMSGDMTVTANFEKISFETSEITMVSIPGGTFQMGQKSVATPVHSVTLSGFEMSTYEITQYQYLAIIGVNPSTGYSPRAAYPVYNVSWYDAVKFCNRLSGQFGLERCYDESTWECDFRKDGFRLPTEAEWEYACRAGTTTNFYTGDMISDDERTSTDLARAGWYWSYYSAGDGVKYVVGRKEPNAFGLFDMHGNVSEWCYDWSGSYPEDSVTNPTGPSKGTSRIYRGGSSSSNAYVCRSAYRRSIYPESASSSIGFRVVRRP